MLVVACDGVRAYIVPDCAECIYAEDNINSMNECPLWKCGSSDECDPDCEYYTENWRSMPLPEPPKEVSE